MASNRERAAILRASEDFSSYGLEDDFSRTDGNPEPIDVTGGPGPKRGMAVGPPYLGCTEAIAMATRVGPRQPTLGVALLTAEETAALLRTSRKAVYAMAERGQLPGLTRIGRRLLVRRDDLLSWLDERRAASPGGRRR